MNQEQLLAFIANCERVKQQAIEEMAKEEHEHEKDFFAGCIHTLNVILVRMKNFVEVQNEPVE